MPTTQLYMEDSYLKTADAVVVDVQENNGQTSLILDKTIFYAQGGGQPADTGKIVGKGGSFAVNHVSYNRGDIQHKGTLTGKIEIGDSVSLSIDWDTRYKNMQAHTAGHILDQAVKNVLPGIKGLDGNHGIGKKLYVVFDQEISADKLPQVQQQVNDIIAANKAITTEFVTLAQIKERGIEVPADLPTNKKLRLAQIGEYPAMPDGGTQLKTTGESWPIEVTSVEKASDGWKVLYTVNNPAAVKTEAPKSSKVEKTDSRTTLSLSQLEAAITQLKAALQADKATQSLTELQSKYLGKKGLFNDVSQSIKSIANTDKKAAGQMINELKSFLEGEFAGASAGKKAAWVDLTMPGLQPKVGHVHPVSQAMAEITGIFEKIGFTRVRYPEVDWDWYVFESLNMPPNHPARDEWETFFVDVPDTTDKTVQYDESQPRKRHPSLVGGKVVLTTHTSNGQVREMERLNSQPPIRMINIARCYRRQQDATHTQMFHQFEGLVVDKNITIQHLKGTLDYFAEQFYGPGTKSRIRPFHFQFTEPSFEVDFSCHICHGTGKREDGEKCKFCKSGWHEVGGAGMVHPNVLKAGGIDPTQYTGFAFGWGVERTYTLKPGLNIDDIRLLYAGDLRFLEQF